MSDDIVARLRSWDHCWPARWLEGATAEAADEIERLRAELAAEREIARTKLMDAAYWQERAEAAEAERDDLRELLRETREYTGYAAYGDRIEADHAVDLCARIDAALNKGGGDE